MHNGRLHDTHYDIVATRVMKVVQKYMYAWPKPLQSAAYLQNVAVTPNSRRRGFGRVMVRAAESAAAVAGRPDMYLHAR